MITPKQESEKSNEVERLKEQIDKIKVKIEESRAWWWQDVKYRDPPSYGDIAFDRKSVKGRVLKLFQIKEERHARALEEIASGKLM